MGEGQRGRKQLKYILLICSLGLASHALIHHYAYRLSGTGQLLRGPRLTLIPAEDRPYPQAATATRTTNCSRLSVLVIHEHHLKPIGSDLRLLGLILQLRSLGHTVSLLFRGKTPADQRSPPTEELASIIGATVTHESSLSVTDRPPMPPAIYEYADLPSLSNLARQGWFDAVLCPLWFWRDPAASSAELLLPTLAFHAPSNRRPFIGVLSDDAHSAKATMMAEWESSDERKALWVRKSRTLPPRQRAVYSLSDAVVHISAADSKLERADFNASCKQWHVLRMSPRGAHAVENVSPTQQEGQDQEDQDGERSLRFGFMGNGVTPTNHLAVQWFIKEVWPEVRRQMPNARLRLVGYAPDDRPKKQQHKVCLPATSATRCGWAWGTSYAGSEETGGIDELGFVADEVMIQELRSWKAMVVPILRSTGVNTKIMPALQLGIPIVLTSVAASPLEIPTDNSVALIADTAGAFIQHLGRLESDSTEATRLGAASLSHWKRLLDEDSTASDLVPLMRLMCQVLASPADSRPIPTPITATEKADLLHDLSAARPQPPTSRCFIGRPPAIFVSMHSAAASDPAVLLMHAAWESLCKHCGLRCAHARGGRKAPAAWDVLIEHEMTASPARVASALAQAAGELAPRPLRFVHAPAAQFPAAFGMYSARGGVLASIAHGERAKSQLPGAMGSTGFTPKDWTTIQLEPLANGTRGIAVDTAWRSSLTAMGLQDSEVQLLGTVAERLRLRFTGDGSPRWHGCFRDDAASRVLADGPRTFGHTTLACAAACTGSPYFAIQNGGQCFCSESPGNESRRVDASECGNVCATEEGKVPPRLCGMNWRNAMYANPAVLTRGDVGQLATPPQLSTVTMGSAEAQKSSYTRRHTAAKGDIKATVNVEPKKSTKKVNDKQKSSWKKSATKNKASRSHRRSNTNKSAKMKKGKGKAHKNRNKK
jgi:glycosyltransferase involved in cell wall biosynthesis